MTSSNYLLAGQASELERLKLQSHVWEPSGRRLLEAIESRAGVRAVDVGCGVMDWLRLLSEWAGPGGEVVGTDVDESMLALAARFVADERLGNVMLKKDDVFATSLEPASFDLVHARYVITPLGRASEQMKTYLGLVRPGGVLVLEDPDVASWHFNPPAQALEELIALIVEAFRKSGGDWNSGRKHLDLFRTFGIEANVRAEVVALPPGHPYLRLPLQFATSLEKRLLALVSAEHLQQLRNDGEAELNTPGRWGTTFTLIQSWGRTSELRSALFRPRGETKLCEFNAFCVRWDRRSIVLLVRLVPIVVRRPLTADQTRRPAPLVAAPGTSASG